MAATDGLSASSTSAADTSVDNDSVNCFVSSDDDGDFFVVERSSGQSAASNKWRAFQQSSANDEFQLNSSWDGDGNGDDSFTSEPQWDADGWTDWDDSEAANDKRKKMPGKDPFNPFTQLVLQSLD
jgi:glucose dehydrogenase